MGNGTIAQMGTSKDIYRTPKNRFVAEFVGRNNIISGKVSKTGTKAIDVDTPAGTFKIPAKGANAAKAGDDLSFSVSADFMHLHTKKPPSKSTINSLPVTLISEEFIGSVVTLFLEGPNGTEFKCQVQERELGDLDMKSEAKLYLSWPVESGHMLEE